MKKNIISVCFIIFFIVSITLFLSFNIFFNKKVNSSEIKKIEENVNDKKTFGMYVQNENGDYVEYNDSNYFPTDYSFNSEKSFCVDKNERILENILIYENNKVTVTSNKTAYCYLYFDKSSSFGEDLLSNPSAGLNTTLEGGLYRFQGANGNVNNYICFGTSDKSTCLGNTDAYMYRIIGVNSNGQVKLIKNEALNSTMQWYSSNTSDITWPNSTIYSNINGSSFLTNSTYMPSGWSEKIVTTTWKYGDNTSINTTAANLYSIENAWSNTTNAKIGLMYFHDYAYAYQSGGLNCSSAGPYSTCKTAWLHISNCDSEAPVQYEWTMSRYGLKSDAGIYMVWSGNGGTAPYNFLDYNHSVRPVFYLTSNVKYVSGTGTSTDPFIIS